MRRVALFALVLTLAALPAFAAPAPGGLRMRVVPPPIPAAELRGSATADGAAPTTPAPGRPTPLFSPFPASANDTAAQCRSVCARAYYFCGSGGDDDNCPQGWSQCVAKCDGP